MTTWRPARSLTTLRDEVNRAAPRRSTRSDGMLGDPAHAARTSDHNPNPAGVVRAIDITHDPAGGCDCRTLSKRIAARLGKHPALGAGAYVIFAGRIISTTRLAEGWRPYTGANQHTQHMHVSVATKAAGYDSTAPWAVTDQEGLDMTEEQLRAIIREEMDRKFGDSKSDSRPNAPDIGNARVVDPDDPDNPAVWTLGHLLFRIARKVGAA